MDERTLQRRRAQRARERRRRRLRRYAAIASLLIVAAGASTAIALSTGSSGRGHRRRDRTLARARASVSAGSRRSGGGSSGTGDPGHRSDQRTRAVPGTRIGPPTGHPGDARVPILMYHVIAAPYPDSPYPALYVPTAEFSDQMRTLQRAGWHAVTLDQVWDNWRDGDRLPAKSFVITFDNGYRTQYTNGLPVLRRLGWVADLNIQLSGLPPDQGGFQPGQVRGLIAAGWELDTQGISHADLVGLDAAQLRAQVASARRTLQRRYHVPVHWFCYPSGQYDATVIAAVKAAGYVGSTTVVPGWASREESPYALPRVRVDGGTTGAQLLAQIESERDDTAPPPSYTTSSP